MSTILAIGQQSFEIVRDRIGAILTAELAAQNYVTGDDLFNATCWMERFLPFHQNEVPAVVVRLAGGTYDNQDVTQVDGLYQYYIDCYVTAKHTSAEKEGSADTLAIVKLHRLLGVCRAILMNPKYKTLGFTPPFVMNRNILNMTIGDVPKQDAANLVMGTLVLQVRVPEDTDLITPPLSQGFDTAVRLDLTDKGYLWSIVTGERFDYTLNHNVA